MTEFSKYLESAMKETEGRLLNRFSNGECLPIFERLVDAFGGEDLLAAGKASRDIADFLKSALGDHGIVEPGPPKTLDRFTLKLNQCHHDGDDDEYVAGIHRAINDLSRIRVIVTDISTIPGILSIIEASITSENGYFSMKSPESIDNELVDITATGYLYLPGGYICECQILHEFAAYTFAVDSLIRKVKSDKENFSLDEGEELPIDMWERDFYSSIKTHLLGAQNLSMSPIDLGKDLYRHLGKSSDEMPKILETILTRMS